MSSATPSESARSDSVPPEIAATAREGADSVYRYIARTAETVPDGRRWLTVDWHNRPHYHPGAGSGVAGVTLFLTDYARLTGTVPVPRTGGGTGNPGRGQAGSQPARDLAIEGLRWCSSPERTVPAGDEWKRYGLIPGEAGIGLAWVRLYTLTRDAAHLQPAQAAGERLLAKEPGPVSDWQDGAAGEGLFLLRLAQACGEPERSRFLGGAGRYAAWLASIARRSRLGTGRRSRLGAGKRTEHGAYWPWEMGSEHETWYGLSFIPGSAGIAHFLLCLFQESGERRWADLAREAAALLRQQAVPDHGGLNWPDTLDGLQRGEELRCQWCYGASGVGQLFVTAHEVLGSSGASWSGDDYLETAIGAGEATFNYGDVRHNPVQCHGLAGSAELFLELYRATRDPLWLRRAHDFARRMLAYRTVTPEGDVWQVDDPGVQSPDFIYGTAGTGHLFLRLLAPLTLTRPLL